MAATSTARPARQEHPGLVIELDYALVAALRPEAKARDVPVSRLVRDLLDTIATDRLTGAILDDQRGNDVA